MLAPAKIKCTNDPCGKTIEKGEIYHEVRYRYDSPITQWLCEGCYKRYCEWLNDKLRYE